MSVRRLRTLGCVCALIGTVNALLHEITHAEVVPLRGSIDVRIRVAAYDAHQVYKLHGFVGYQIDLEFEPGETFTGLGAGDIEALAFNGQENHLFLKPKAAKVATNLTVLTNRRHYQFDYIATTLQPGSADEVIYALQFTYPPSPKIDAAASAKRLDSKLERASMQRAQNMDYWYCGNAALRPIAASDDGIHTRLRFRANADLPAIFVRNADDSESLLNFNMDAGDVVIHRVAIRFILRRGKLTGCVVNTGYAGNGTRLESGTIAPDVERRVQEVQP